MCQISCFQIAPDAPRISRRRWLTVGGLAALARLLGPERAPGEVPHARAVTSASSFGRAKRCLLLFLTGGPPQHDTWDPKPDAPSNIRGELAPIATSAPGIMVSELFPQLAKVAHQFLCLGEFGRTPTVNGKAGRDHWPHVANALVAGAGIPGGTVVGASDSHGAYPAHTPITPEDWGATLLHWLGIDPQREMHDQLGRPHRLGLGHVHPELFG